jgi:hypothetical protein
LATVTPTLTIFLIHKWLILAAATSSPELEEPVDEVTTTAPSTEDSGSNTTNANDDEEVDTTFSVSINPLILNYFFVAPPSNAKKAVNGSHEELTKITSRHIHRTVNAKLEDNLVESAQPILEPVSTTSPWNNSTVVSTFTLKGTLIFKGDMGPPRESTINRLVASAFSGSPLRNYLMDLQTSPDTMLKRTYSIYVGLPSDIVDTTSTGEETNKENENTWDKIDSFFVETVNWGDWNSMEFIIFAVACGCFIVCLFLVTYICCRLRRRRKLREQAFLLEAVKSGETNAMSPTYSDECEDGQTPKFSNMDVSTRQTNDVAYLAPVVESLTRRTSDIDTEAGVADEVGSSILDVSQTDGKMSDTVSIYSYLDDGKAADVDYSVSEALNYNPHIDGDEQSTQWSVVDNKALTHNEKPKNSGSSKILAALGDNLDTSVTTDESGGRLLIFSEEEPDDVSLLSTTLQITVVEDGEADKSATVQPTSTKVAAIAAAFERGRVKNNENAGMNMLASPAEPASDKSRLIEEADLLNNSITAPSSRERKSDEGSYCSKHSEQMSKASGKSSVRDALSCAKSENTDQTLTRTNRAPAPASPVSVPIPSESKPPVKNEKNAMGAENGKSKGSFVIRNRGFKAWGMKIRNSSNEKPATTQDIKPSWSQATAPNFNKQSVGTSKASQIALSSPGKDVNDENYEPCDESESDIQSICTQDVYNNSFFSPGSSNTNDEFKVGHLPTGKELVGDLLGSHDTSQDEEDLISNLP